MWKRSGNDRGHLEQGYRERDDFHGLMVIRSRHFDAHACELSRGRAEDLSDRAFDDVETPWDANAAPRTERLSAHLDLAMV
jgi:hypothetical protein